MDSTILMQKIKHPKIKLPPYLSDNIRITQSAVAHISPEVFISSQMDPLVSVDKAVTTISRSSADDSPQSVLIIDDRALSVTLRIPTEAFMRRGFASSILMILPLLRVSRAMSLIFSCCCLMMDG